jgi:hypothetical protein
MKQGITVTNAILVMGDGLLVLMHVLSSVQKPIFMKRQLISDPESTQQQHYMFIMVTKT